ncbi:unnamed protein product [Closterium sp. NIES-65]|nr:unnamed protein product [Closterium sp. NIES-65]
MLSLASPMSSHGSACRVPLPSFRPTLRINPILFSSLRPTPPSLCLLKLCSVPPYPHPASPHSPIPPFPHPPIPHPPIPPSPHFPIPPSRIPPFPHPPISPSPHPPSRHPPTPQASPIRAEDLECPVPLAALARSLQHTPLSGDEVDVLPPPLPHRTSCTPSGAQGTGGSSSTALTAPTAASSTSGNSGSPSPHMSGCMDCGRWSMHHNPMAACGLTCEGAWEEEVQQEVRVLEASEREQQQAVAQLEQYGEEVGEGRGEEREGGACVEEVEGGEECGGRGNAVGAGTEGREDAEGKGKGQGQECESVSEAVGVGAKLRQGGSSEACIGGEARAVRASVSGGGGGMSSGHSRQAERQVGKGEICDGEWSRETTAGDCDTDGGEGEDGEEGGGEVVEGRGVRAWVVATVTALERAVEGVLQMVLLAAAVLLLAVLGNRLAAVVHTEGGDVHDFVPT